LDSLALSLLPGGRYYLLAFTVEFPPPSPRQVTEVEVRARFSPAQGWQIRALRPAEFLSRIAPVPALCACIELNLNSTSPPTSFDRKKNRLLPDLSIRQKQPSFRGPACPT
jgi:hypothetical protein